MRLDLTQGGPWWFLITVAGLTLILWPIVGPILWGKRAYERWVGLR